MPRAAYVRNTILFVLFALAQAGCSILGPAPTPQVIVVTATQAAPAPTQTPYIITATAVPDQPTAVPPSATPQVIVVTATPVPATQTPFVITNTPAPTATRPPATATSVPTVVPTMLPTQAVDCNQVTFVADVTYPDGTEIRPNTAFTKVWRVKNSGSCTWTPNYKLVYTAGDTIGGSTYVNLATDVVPGQQVDISVGFVSPSKNGEYKSYWKFQAPNGEIFGLGAKKTTAMWVDIRVGPPPVVFAVTSVGITSDARKITACTYTMGYTAEISVNAPGTVVFWWMHGDSEVEEVTTTFSKAGTKTFYHEWDLSVTAGKIKTFNLYIYIDSPNNQRFGPARVEMTCI